jgi:hypothetical protein
MMDEMNKDTEVSLHRRKFGQDDRMTASGRFEDVFRQFKSLPESKKIEYSIMAGGMEYASHEIENLARDMGLK